MMYEDSCRHLAIKILKYIEHARHLFTHHLLSVGYAGEFILRRLLIKILPSSYSICQGFIINKEKLSRQCDIIIYKKNKSAIYKAFGELKVVDSEFVVAVIEVKSSISKETFHSTLRAFELLEELRVTNCFLFIYGKLTQKSLQKWLIEYKYPCAISDKYIITDSYLYDWDDNERLPNAILALDSNKYYNLGHISAYNDDWVGYLSLEITDSKDAQINCLQEFFTSIVMLVNGYIPEMDINKYSIKHGIELFRL